MKNKITIIWGTDAVKGKEKAQKGCTKKTYTFDNEEQAKFFMQGVDEANGWLEYEVR